MAAQQFKSLLTEDCSRKPNEPCTANKKRPRTNENRVMTANSDCRMLTTLLFREQMLVKGFYRTFNLNQQRKRQNEIDHLKRQIMGKFRAELKVHIEENTRKLHSRN